MAAPLSLFMTRKNLFFTGMFLLLLAAGLGQGLLGYAYDDDLDFDDRQGAQDSWRLWRSEGLAYEMLLRTDMRIGSRDYRDGWRGDEIVTDGPLILFVMNHPDPRMAQSTLLDFVSRFMGIPSPVKVTTPAMKDAGWRWVADYEGMHRNRIQKIVIGQGLNGSYVFVLATDPENDRAFTGYYGKWRRSIKLID